MANNQWKGNSDNNADWNDSQENLNPNQGSGQNQQRSRYNDQQRGHASYQPDSDYNTGTNYGNTYNQRYQNDYNPDNYGRDNRYNATDNGQRSRYQSERHNSNFDHNNPYNRTNRYDSDYNTGGYERQYSASSYDKPYRDYERGVGREGVGYNRDYRHDYNRNNYNRREDWRNTNYGYGKYDTNYGYGDNYGNMGYGRSYNQNDRNDYRPYDDNNRDWWDRASDEVSSWFGDRDAERRRYLDKQEAGMHRGRGPKGYKRSDERIREDINDRLSDDHYVDASDVEVKVENGDVILSGNVNSRAAKRRAEDIVESISGVSNVENRIRVSQHDTPSGSTYNYSGTNSPANNLTGNTTTGPTDNTKK